MVVTLSEIRIPAPASSAFYLSGYVCRLRPLPHISNAAGVYAMINPARGDLVARAANRFQPWAKHTTADGDIRCRRWLPLDFDPVRPAGVSTDNKHAAANAADKQRFTGGIKRSNLFFGNLVVNYESADSLARTRGFVCTYSRRQPAKRKRARQLPTGRWCVCDR